MTSLSNTANTSVLRTTLDVFVTYFICTCIRRTNNFQNMNFILCTFLLRTNMYVFVTYLICTFIRRTNNIQNMNVVLCTFLLRTNLDVFITYIICTFIRRTNNVQRMDVILCTSYLRTNEVFHERSKKRRLLNVHFKSMDVRTKYEHRMDVFCTSHAHWDGFHSCKSHHGFNPNSHHVFVA